MTRPIVKFLIASALILLASPASFASEQDGRAGGLRLIQGDSPSGSAVFLRPDRPEKPQVPTDWLLRTGIKKGIRELTLDEEIAAAPDIAVLAAGFFDPWTEFLTAMKEPSLPVDRDAVALLARTKPALIIPSGGLSGTSGSEFFRAGLAEYARSGGAIVCFSQRTGADYASLPVPAGSKLEAMGWSQDAGPVFGASFIRTSHPALSRMARPDPRIETSGYLTAVPEGARVLLTRSDGHPTLITYPFGSGRVVVAALFPDVLLGQGHLGPEEQALVQDLLRWAKTPAEIAQAAKGDRLSLMFQVPGAEREEVASVKLLVIGPEKDDPVMELEASIPSKAKTPVMLPFTTTIDDRFRPGIYRVEYVLLDLRARRLSGRTEAAGGWFSVGRPPVAAPRKPEKPVSSTPEQLRIQPSVQQPERGVFPERRSYRPGETARIRVLGMGSGELSLTGLGQMESNILPENGAVSLTVPDGLPAGAYPLSWEYRAPGGVSAGEALINIAGYTVSIQDASVAATSEKGAYTVTALHRIRSDRTLNGILRAVLHGPDGGTMPSAEQPLSLQPGMNEVPVSITFKPEQAGIWELSSSILTTLPEGAGYPSGPVSIASRSDLIDLGDAAVLGIATERPVYYDPSGPVKVLASLSGKGRSTLRISLDGKTVSKERGELSGALAASASLTDVKPGWHSLRAALEGDGPGSSRELGIVYGTRLPDLEASVLPADPAEAVMELGLGVRNRGRAASGKTRAVLYEGDPAKGGRLIEKADIPPLEPGQLHVSLVRWPLFKKAGPRLFTAAVDRENAVPETNERNNIASAEALVPDFLVTVRPAKKTSGMSEPVPYAVSLANFTAGRQKALSLAIEAIGTSGAPLFTETIPIDELSTSREKIIERVFTPSAPLAPGLLLISARLAQADREVAMENASVRVPPVLSLAGTLAGTPAKAVLCGPFTVRYSVQSTGNVPVSSGAVSIELRQEGADKPALTRKAPLMPDPKPITIERLDVPAGRSILSLKASAASQEHKISRDFALAEQELLVAGPVTADAAGSFPRVLVWLGRAGGTAERALSESIIKQAFEHEGVYYRIVDAPDDFAVQAMSGTFNTFVIFEAGDPLDNAGWLRDLAGQGQGMVIIGTEETEKAAAATFGFTLGEPLSRTGGLLTMSDAARLGVSGTVPVSGILLSPRKKGAVTLAATADNKPAALIDAGGKSKVAVLPFSLIRSARESGSSAIYSLLLRAVVLAAAPAHAEQEDATAGSIALSAPAGPVKAKVVVSLPTGAEALWTSAEGKVQENVITYEMALDAEPKKVLYLYQKAAEGVQEKPVMEVFYECEGKWVSQGKIE